jgi:hypothetical protein
MDLSWLWLLRTHADTGGLEEAQRERAGTNPNRNRRPRHQATSHDAHGFAGQKAQFGEAPPQFDRGGSVGWRYGDHARASSYT